MTRGIPTAADSSGQRALWVALATSILACASSPAEAEARYRVRLTAEIEIVPRAIGLGFGFHERAVTTDPPAEGPGVVFTHGGEAWSLGIAQTIFADASAEGTAFYIGSGDAAVATGATYAQASFDVVNERETPVSFDVQVRIRGCSFEGSVEEDWSELASTVLAVQLFGSAALGIPEEPVALWRRSTRDEEIGDRFDLVCVPFSRTFTLTVPGYTDPLVFEFLTLGLRVTAGGQAISPFGNSVSLPLETAPPLELQPAAPLDLASRFAALLHFFEDAIEAKRLFGTGSRGHAWKHRVAMRHLLERAEALAVRGKTRSACERLMTAFRRSDGVAALMDYVKGPALGELAFRIRDLGRSLDCPLSGHTLKGQ